MKTIRIDPSKVPDYIVGEVLLREEYRNLTEDEKISLGSEIGMAVICHYASKQLKQGERAILSLLNSGTDQVAFDFGVLKQGDHLVFDAEKMRETFGVDKEEFYGEFDQFSDTMAKFPADENYIHPLSEQMVVNGEDALNLWYVASLAVNAVRDTPDIPYTEQSEHLVKFALLEYPDPLHETDYVVAKLKQHYFWAIQKCINALANSMQDAADKQRNN